MPAKGNTTNNTTDKPLLTATTTTTRQRRQQQRHDHKNNNNDKMQSPYNALDDQLTTQGITNLRILRFTLEPKHDKTVTITTGNTPLIPNIGISHMHSNHHDGNEATTKTRTNSSTTQHRLNHIHKTGIPTST